MLCETGLDVLPETNNTKNDNFFMLDKRRTLDLSQSYRMLTVGFGISHVILHSQPKQGAAVVTGLDAKRFGRYVSAGVGGQEGFMVELMYEGRLSGWCVFVRPDVGRPGGTEPQLLSTANSCDMSVGDTPRFPILF